MIRAWPPPRSSLMQVPSHRVRGSLQPAFHVELSKKREIVHRRRSSLWIQMRFVSDSAESVRPIVSMSLSGSPSIKRNDDALLIIKFRETASWTRANHPLLFVSLDNDLTAIVGSLTMVILVQHLWLPYLHRKMGVWSKQEFNWHASLSTFLQNVKRQR